MTKVTSSPHVRLFFVCLLGFRNERVANASNVFDWAPSISLTDNFGVAEGLCPDIAGFGANLNCDGILQLHTCKSQGADTQFLFDFDTNEIKSVNYDSDCQSLSSINGEDSSKGGACVTIDGSISAGDNLRLAPCNGESDQSFSMWPDGSIRTVADFNLCLAKTSDVGPAGPNERTDFALAACQTADLLDIAWTVNTPLSPCRAVTRAELDASGFSDGDTIDSECAKCDLSNPEGRYDFYPCNKRDPFICKGRCGFFVGDPTEITVSKKAKAKAEKSR